MSNPQDLQAAAQAIQRATGYPALQELLQAKKESDRRNYATKGAILRRLLEQEPQNFAIDSEEGNIVGLTHLPTRFRIHTLRNTLPGRVNLARLPRALAPAVMNH